MRQRKQQSLTEVSGAVEIDAESLSDIEQGKRRPDEEILMLLISYFSVKDSDAVKVWEMAGYERPDENTSSRDTSQHTIMVMPMDARIVYTDIAHISTTDYGVTINFSQTDGLGNSQPLTVSRVGMSHDHALKLLKTLEKSLRPKEQKLLPAPDKSDDKTAES